MLDRAIAGIVDEALDEKIQSPAPRTQPHRPRRPMPPTARPRWRASTAPRWPSARPSIRCAAGRLISKRSRMPSWPKLQGAISCRAVRSPATCSRPAERRLLPCPFPLFARGPHDHRRRTRFHRPGPGRDDRHAVGHRGLARPFRGGPRRCDVLRLRRGRFSRSDGATGNRADDRAIAGRGGQALTRPTPIRRNWEHQPSSFRSVPVRIPFPAACAP